MNERAQPNVFSPAEGALRPVTQIEIDRRILVL
jgi:hypothetical protein